MLSLWYVCLRFIATPTIQCAIRMDTTLRYVGSTVRDSSYVLQLQKEGFSHYHATLLAGARRFSTLEDQLTHKPKTGRCCRFSCKMLVIECCCCRVPIFFFAFTISCSYGVHNTIANLCCTMYYTKFKK